ncbi:MAG TPA: FAD-binding protein [Gemmatimonadales bacterium]|nr:FAD-binding protein [Gemmatimonadales bacterium]
MKIAVLIRRTPDTTAKIAIAASGDTIDPNGVKFVPNPYDEYAVEAAITLAAANPGSETVAIAFGADSVQETLRTALAVGIDRAEHLQGEPSADGLANARVLADHLRSGGYDLILCGKLAVDDYGQQTGAMIAELLELPCATAITSLEVRDCTGGARGGGWHGAVELLAAGPVHLRQGPQHSAASGPQGNHGGQEEAARCDPGDSGWVARQDRVADPPRRAPCRADRGRGCGSGTCTDRGSPFRSEGDLMATVLAVLEQRDGALRKGAAELLAAARQLADANGDTVDALICSATTVAGADALGAAGADRVLSAVHPDFGQYCPDGIVATVASLPAPRAVVVSATATGKDLAPRIAARLDAPCGMDVTAVSADGDAIRVIRPVYAGKAIQTLDLSGSVVVAVRPGAYAAVSAGKAGAVESVVVPSFTRRITVAGISAPEQEAVDVAEARVVIAGGRGLGDPKHFALLEELAAAFGGEAAVGASRAVVDAGWIGHGAQVGQTGKTVAPELYFAIGISGAIQHLAGMRTARTIVAINRDKDAPIFKVADYGIVGDLFEVMPALTEAVRKAKS